MLQQMFNLASQDPPYGARVSVVSIGRYLHRFVADIPGEGTKRYR